MINIQSITYTNESGEAITVDFKETEIEYRADRLSELIQEMMFGNQKLGPPPKKTSETESAWLDGEF